MVLEILHSETFEEFKKALLPIVPTETLIEPYRSDRCFRQCYAKFGLLVRKGFKEELVWRHFESLKDWPLVCLLTSPDSPRKQRESVQSGYPRERGFELQRE